MKRTSSRVEWIGGVGVVAAALFGGLDALEEHIRKIAPYVPSELFIASLVIAIVCTSIAVLCGILYAIFRARDLIVETPDVDWIVAPSKAEDVVSIHKIANQDISDDISGMENTRRCLRKNRNCFFTLRRNVTFRSGKVKSEFLGYFCAIPLNEDAANRIIDGRLRGQDIDEDHITSQSETPFAIYIGGIAGKGSYPQGMLMRELRWRLEEAEKAGVKCILARGATSEGRSKLDKYGFECLRTDDGVPLYKLRLPIELHE